MIGIKQDVQSWFNGNKSFFLYTYSDYEATKLLSEDDEEQSLLSKNSERKEKQGKNRPYFEKQLDKRQQDQSYKSATTSSPKTPESPVQLKSDSKKLRLQHQLSKNKLLKEDSSKLKLNMPYFYGKAVVDKKDQQAVLLIWSIVVFIAAFFMLTLFLMSNQNKLTVQSILNGNDVNMKTLGHPTSIGMLQQDKVFLQTQQNNNQNQTNNSSDELQPGINSNATVIAPETESKVANEPQVFLEDKDIYEAYDTQISSI